MKKILAAGLGLLIAVPAFAQSMGEKTGANALLGVTPSTQDFVTEAATSDMLEIRESQLAADRSDAATKSFAQHMITDHQKTSSDLQSMVKGGTVQATVPTALDSSHQAMLDKLNGLQGAAFTTQYHSDQVSAHKDAVSLFQRYANGGDNPGLKDWAGKTLPTLQNHLQMAQQLDK